MSELNVQENAMSDVNHVIIVPNIEEDIPLPKNAAEALPEMTVAEEIQMRANTIKLLADLKGEHIEPNYSDVKDAESLATEMVNNPALRPEFGNYTNETTAFLAGMVSQMNCMIVKDLADMKLYVLNKLVLEAEQSKNAKERISALRAIGEVDGVDAFKKKTEVTHKLETMEEVEKELLSMLGELKQKALLKPKAETIDAEVVEDDTSNNS
jgi:hypothetical protein